MSTCYRLLIENEKYNDINDPRRYAKFNINNYNLIKIDGIYFFGATNDIHGRLERGGRLLRRIDRIKIK